MRFFSQNVMLYRKTRVTTYRAVVAHVREHRHVQDRPVTGDGDRQRLPQAGKVHRQLIEEVDARQHGQVPDQLAVDGQQQARPAQPVPVAPRAQEQHEHSGHAALQYRLPDEHVGDQLLHGDLAVRQLGAVLVLVLQVLAHLRVQFQFHPARLLDVQVLVGQYDQYGRDQVREQHRFDRNVLQHHPVQRFLDGAAVRLFRHQLLTIVSRLVVALHRCRHRRRV